MNRTFKFVTAGLAVAAMSLGGAAIAQADTTTEDGQSLAFMREEERLAHDLYTALGEKYDSVVWDRISASEQRHFDAVGRLLDIQGLDDPSEGKAAGTYDDATLQALYDDWYAAGSASEDAAFQAAIELEQRDIADLEATIADLDGDDETTMVLTALLRASERHEASFTRWADGEGGVGVPPEWAGQGGYGDGTGVCDGTGAGDRSMAQNGSGDSAQRGGRRGGGMGLMDGSGSENAPRRAATNA